MCSRDDIISTYVGVPIPSSGLIRTVIDYESLNGYHFSNYFIQILSLPSAGHADVTRLTSRVGSINSKRAEHSNNGHQSSRVGREVVGLPRPRSCSQAKNAMVEFEFKFRYA